MKRAPDAIIFSFLKLYRLFKQRFPNPFEWLNGYIWLAECGKMDTSYIPGRRKQ